MQDYASFSANLWFFISRYDSAVEQDRFANQLLRFKLILKLAGTVEHASCVSVDPNE